MRSSISQTRSGFDSGRVRRRFSYLRARFELVHADVEGQGCPPFGIELPALLVDFGHVQLRGQAEFECALIAWGDRLSCSSLDHAGDGVIAVEAEGHAGRATKSVHLLVFCKVHGQEESRRVSFSAPPEHRDSYEVGESSTSEA